MAIPKNFSSWDFTKRMIKIGHNRDVTRHFKDIQADDRRDTGRSAVKTGLLIRDSDSALEILNKQLFFRLGMDGANLEAIASTAEGWVLKAGEDIPQLVIVFRAKGKKSSYQISIPHYNGGRSPDIPSYRKGSYRGCLTLKDNSKLTVFAGSRGEAERMIRSLRKYVEPKFAQGREPLFGEMKNSYVEVTVHPVMADFYPEGKNGERAWRTYF